MLKATLADAQYSMHSQTELTVPEAQAILKVFTCLDNGSAEAPPAPAVVRQALHLVASCSDYQIFGICADSVSQGLAALESYTQALGYLPESFQVNPVEGPAYIKFNPKTGLCYAETYSGQHRGVLVSCQSPISGSINDLYGHLPLNLFESEA
jgi:hypothetical protein